MTASPPPTAPGARGRIAILLNPRSGTLLGAADRCATVEMACRRLGLAPWFVPDAGTLPERMDVALSQDIAALVVAGGDGTIACAANALAGSTVPLGILPAGTANLLARDLALPMDWDDALAVIAAGTVRPVDVGDVRGADGIPHLFLCAAMLGEPARLARVRESGRRAGGGIAGWLMLALAATRALRNPSHLRGTLHVDGRRVRLRTPSLTLTVGALDPATGRPFGRSRLDSGRLVAYRVRPTGIAGLLHVAWRMFRHGGRRTPNIDILDAAAFTLQAAGPVVRVIADGEMRLTPPPLRFSVRPGGLRVFAPVAAVSPATAEENAAAGS